MKNVFLSLKNKVQQMGDNIKSKLKKSQAAESAAREIKIIIIKNNRTLRTLSSADNAETQAKNYSTLISEIINYDFESVVDIYGNKAYIYLIPKKNDIREGGNE